MLLFYISKNQYSNVKTPRATSAQADYQSKYKIHFLNLHKIKNMLVHKIHNTYTKTKHCNNNLHASIPDLAAGSRHVGGGLYMKCILVHSTCCHLLHPLAQITIYQIQRYQIMYYCIKKNMRTNYEVENDYYIM